MDAFTLPILLLAYFIGSIPSGILLARFMGVTDPRQGGSGNIGASNMARVGGRKLGALTFLADFLKALLPTLAAQMLFPNQVWLASAVGTATVLGHCYSIFLRGHGGKGVSSTAGAFAVITPVAAGIAVAVWAATFVSRKITSLAAATAILALVLAVIMFGREWTSVAAMLVCALVAIRRHEENWEALMKGNERQF